MLYARATVAGALVMLLGAWILADEHLTTERTIAATLMVVAIMVLLLGVDIRRKRD